MRKLILFIAISAILFSFGSTVQAEQPFISISSEPDKVVLNMTPGIFGLEVYAPLTINVESNCLHGAIVASITPLVHQTRGITIPKERIFIQAPATVGYVSMSKPVTISRTTAGSHSIVMSIKAVTNAKDIAGTYKGMIAFTIMPP